LIFGWRSQGDWKMASPNGLGRSPCEATFGIHDTRVEETCKFCESRQASRSINRRIVRRGPKKIPSHTAESRRRAVQTPRRNRRGGKSLVRHGASCLLVRSHLSSSTAPVQPQFSCLRGFLSSDRGVWRLRMQHARFCEVSRQVVILSFFLLPSK